VAATLLREWQLCNNSRREQADPFPPERRVNGTGSTLLEAVGDFHVARAAGQCAVARETLTEELYREAQPLMAQHHEDVSPYPDIELDVDIDRYLAAEAADLLRVYVARADAALVGYAMFLVAPHGHARGSRQALCDSLFVAPHARKRDIGLRLLRHCDAALSLEGVQIVIHNESRANPSLGVILPRMGYDWIGRVWAKRLDRLEH
jgi:GNAT superfamily N-acetyltransferase